MSRFSSPAHRSHLPWFQWHPTLAAGIATALYAAVFALRWTIGGTDEAIALLYVLPIALIAVAFGARAGAAGGGAGVVLLAIWVLAAGETLTPVGWLARGTPMLLVGVLVGAAADNLRDSAAAEGQLVVAAQRERQAAEINDAIVQRISAAKWAFEAGADERGGELLTDSIERAQVLVADLLHGRKLREEPSSGAANTPDAPEGHSGLATRTAQEGCVPSRPWARRR